MARVLIVTIYLFGAAAIGGAIGLFEGLGIGAAAGGVLFLAALQIQSSAAARKHRRMHAREIGNLQRANAAIEVALHETHEKMEEITKAIEARADAQGRKIVAELQVLESLMREFAGKISQTAPRASRAAMRRRAAPRQGTAARLSRHAGRAASCWRPSAPAWRRTASISICSPSSACRSASCAIYEALSRLRAEDGSVIMPAQYIKVAAPAGLMSVVDNLLLFRCVQIVRRLTQKSRDIGVFCNISGDTLADAEFFPQFLDYMQANRDLAGQIMFEFAQDAVLKAGAQGEDNLAYLAEPGLCAVDGSCRDAWRWISRRLKTIGFRHLKVRADTLTRGMSGAGAAVPPRISRSCSPATAST